MSTVLVQAAHDSLGFLSSLLLLAAETPEPEDVKAGWTGLVVLIGLIAAVGLLLVSMARHVRKLRRLQAEDELLEEDALAAEAEDARDVENPADPGGLTDEDAADPRGSERTS